MRYLKATTIPVEVGTLGRIMKNVHYKNLRKFFFIGNTKELANEH